MKLSDDLFESIIKHCPLISIDFVIKDNNMRVLLGKRKNEPAKGYWFTPGGRIFKDESITDACIRILRDELNIHTTDPNYSIFNITEHFYSNNFYNNDFSTHYINISMTLHDFDINSIVDMTAQHTDIIWLTIPELIRHKNVHFNAKKQFHEYKFKYVK